MEGEFICAICMDNAAGFRLRPCGHDHFCKACALQLFSCPLCRVPLLIEDGVVQSAEAPQTSAARVQDERAVVASRTVLTRTEVKAAQGIGLGVWFFIFVVGIVEHMHDQRQSCDIGDPPAGQGPHWLTATAMDNDTACAECGERSICAVCSEGYHNLGAQCFKHLENMPALKTGAALGGTTYFVLIVAIQCIGIVSEVLLIRRLFRRKLMPRKELVILCMALCTELVRMFLTDVFVMREYFGGRAYKIFRQPLPCTPSSTMSWQAADSHWYCPDLSPHTADTHYYVADHETAWSMDRDMCSTFTTASPLLNFDERSPQDITRVIPGSNHRRFRTIGWIIGGEFAIYYFFATFINEVADIMFVVPTTTSSGWLCKIFSVALEVFQLGALCPAAIFSHQDCLHYTNPLDVPLGVIRTVVIVFGYCLWGFVFISVPLAVGALLFLGALYMLCIFALGFAPVLRALARCSCCRPSRALSEAADALDRFKITMGRWLESAQVYAKETTSGFINATMIMAFLPMLCGGMFLGTLVVIGQGSKQGAMQVLTAIVLLSDVLFKVFATVTTEVGSYLLHRHVNRIVASGLNRRSDEVTGTVIGVSM